MINELEMNELYEETFYGKNNIQHCRYNCNEVIVEKGNESDEELKDQEKQKDQSRPYQNNAPDPEALDFFIIQNQYHHQNYVPNLNVNEMQEPAQSTLKKSKFNPHHSKIRDKNGTNHIMGRMHERFQKMLLLLLHSKTLTPHKHPSQQIRITKPLNSPRLQHQTLYSTPHNT